MFISSTLLALDLATNFEEVTNASYSVICIVEDFTTTEFVAPLEELLSAKNLGKVLPIIESGNEMAFTIILENLYKAIRVIKRSLRESGVLLSTKIVLTRPELRLLKDFGVGE